MELAAAIQGICNIIKGENSDVFFEYEAVPVDEHTSVYVVTSIEKIGIKNLYKEDSYKCYETEFQLKVRVLGKPSGNPLLLYYRMEETAVSSLAKSGYVIKTIQINSPYQDKGLNRMVLEGIFVVAGKLEVI